MKIKLDGEEVKLQIGEWIQTDTLQGKIISFDEVYDSITIVGSYDNCNTTIRPRDVIKLGGKSFSAKVPESTDSLLKFLEDNPVEGAMKEHSKDGIEKPKMSLIPQRAIVEVAHVMSYGAKKYEAYNFSKGAYKTTYTDAAQRHINRYLLNEDVDDESRLPHLAHAISCLLMLLDNDLIGTSIDDRNKEYK